MRYDSWGGVRSAFADVRFEGSFKNGKVGDKRGGWGDVGTAGIEVKGFHNINLESDWELVDGEVPYGTEMQFYCQYAALYGTFKKAGTYTFTIMWKHRFGNASLAKEYSVTVLDNPDIPTPKLYGTIGNITPNSPFSKAITVSDGTAPYEWSYTGELPPGLSFRGSDTDTTGNKFELSGTTTAEEGTYNFTVKVKDFYDKTAEKSFTVKVSNTPTSTENDSKGKSDSDTSSPTNNGTGSNGGSGDSITTINNDNSQTNIDDHSKTENITNITQNETKNTDNDNKSLLGGVSTGGGGCNSGLGVVILLSLIAFRKSHR